MRGAYAIQLAAKVNRVDVIAFEVGEHDDLSRWSISEIHSAKYGT